MWRAMIRRTMARPIHSRQMKPALALAVGALALTCLRRRTMYIRSPLRENRNALCQSSSEVEQGTHKPLVGGSIPSSGTSFVPRLFKNCLLVPLLPHPGVEFGAQGLQSLLVRRVTRQVLQLVRVRIQVVQLLGWAARPARR